MSVKPAIAALLLLAFGACENAARPAQDSDDAGDEGDAAALDAGAPLADAEAPALDAAVAEPRSSDELFAEAAGVWHFELELAPTDLAWLDAHAVEEEYVPGNVRFGEQSFENASVRYKGGYGSLVGCFDAEGNLTCSKLSLKVSFNERDKSGRFLGLRKLVFHACNRDRTCLRERLSYGLFRDMGIETCRTAYATVSINGGPRQLYVLVENIDKEFLEDHFADPEGNLYKERWPVVPVDSYYVDGLETNESTADVARMTELAQLVTSVELASYDAELGPHLDLEAMGRYTAVDQLIHNWDGIWKFYCGAPDQCGNHNYFAYDDPTSGRLAIIPWDLDHTFTEPNPDLGRSFHDDSAAACEFQPLSVPGLEGLAGIMNPQCDPLLRGVYLGNGWQRYKGALRELVEGEQTNRDIVLARLNHYRALVRSTLEADPSALPLAQWEGEVAKLRQIIHAQYDAAEELLAEP